MAELLKSNTLGGTGQGVNRLAELMKIIMQPVGGNRPGQMAGGPPQGQQNPQAQSAQRFLANQELLKLISQLVKTQGGPPQNQPPPQNLPPQQGAQ